MELKGFQQSTLDVLRRYLEALRAARAKHEPILASSRDGACAWDREAWGRIGRDPRDYISRQNGLGAAVPNVCLKLPTGGGKTLLAVKAIDAINHLYRRQQTGLVLWIVPTSQIYRQTLRALRDRDHPYRQLLDLSSAGKTLILEKDTLFSPAAVREHLAILVLMLPAANRQNKQPLRLFRDQGGFEAFFPPEDSWQEHTSLIAQIPNLDTFEAASFSGARVIKTSLGNTLRLLGPVVVLDEGHKACSATARETLFGFNPSFVLELSATPSSESNILVEIGGQDVLREGMIKLDLHLHVTAGAGWRGAMLASHERRLALERIAQHYAIDGGDYIRPICLIQVERTGAKQRRPEFIHAEDVRAFLIERCNVLPEWIAVKSSERDEIESADLLDPGCPIRYIITRHALQEGWDCPFAYVLAVLIDSEATTAITQLVGRVLRQPYARKTGRAELDESYVYCFRDKSGRGLRAVQAGLRREGLDDLAARVVLDAEAGCAREPRLPAGAERPKHAGRACLLCFVTPDGRGCFREMMYEIDVLSRVDWSCVDLSSFDRLDLSLAERQDAPQLVEVDETASQLHISEANDSSIDLVSIARRLIDIVPNPWVAYDFARDAVGRLLARYDAALVGRARGFVVHALKKQLESQRDQLAEGIFRGLIERQEVRLYLLAGCAGAAAPAQIVEQAAALYLERQRWALEWWRRAAQQGDPAVYVLETKALDLKHRDTSHNQTLFRLCPDLGRPMPWRTIAGASGGDGVYFRGVFADEWQCALSAMLEG
jgi:type III restriction enzyme